MPANDGCHASNGFLSVGGAGCSIIHFFPFTAPGRNNNPSSAMNVMNASRVFFSSAIFENACSVFTISCNADCPCATEAIANINNATTIFTPINPSPIRLNPRPQWQPVTHFPESTHQCYERWKVDHDTSPPTDHTSQTTQANTNSPSTPLYSPPHKQRLSRRPAPCCRCQFHASAHQAAVCQHPGAADAQRSLSADSHPITIQHLAVRLAF